MTGGPSSAPDSGNHDDETSDNAEVQSSEPTEINNDSEPSREQAEAAAARVETTEQGDEEQARSSEAANNALESALNDSDETSAEGTEAPSEGAETTETETTGENTENSLNDLVNEINSGNFSWGELFANIQDFFKNISKYLFTLAGIPGFGGEGLDITSLSGRREALAGKELLWPNATHFSLGKGPNIGRVTSPPSDSRRDPLDAEGGYKPHHGVDISAPVGVPIYLTQAAKVVSSSGHVIKLQYADGTYGRFVHLDSRNVSVGDSIQPGHLVGRTGKEGGVTGPHLHYEAYYENGGLMDPFRHLPGLRTANYSPPEWSQHDHRHA